MLVAVVPGDLVGDIGFEKDELTGAWRQFDTLVTPVQDQVAGVLRHVDIVGAGQQLIVVIVPVIVVITGPLINRTFSGTLAPFRRVAWAGFVAKMVGGFVGYRVRVDAYGTGDAIRYDRAGKQIAGDVWNGPLSVLDAIPTSTGTH